MLYDRNERKIAYFFISVYTYLRENNEAVLDESTIRQAKTAFKASFSDDTCTYNAVLPCGPGMSNSSYWYE